MKWSQCEPCRACSIEVICSSKIYSDPIMLKRKGKTSAGMTGKRHISIFVRLQL